MNFEEQRSISVEEARERLGMAIVGLEGARAILAELMGSLEPGLISAVLKLRAAALLQVIDPAVSGFRELEKLTEAEAGPAFLREFGARLDVLVGSSGEVTTLLEAAYGASVGDDLEAIRQTVRTLTLQAREITVSLQDYERRSASPGAGEKEE